MLRFLRSPLATPVALALATVALVFATSAWSSPATSPRAHAAATCADYPDQAAAQRAADTRDADGDGIYCEYAAVPVRGTRATAGGAAAGARRPRPLQAQLPRPAGVQPITFSKTKYPNIRRHFLRRAAPRLAAHPGAQPPRRRRPPRPAARGHPDPRRLRPRRVPAGGRPRQGQGPRARPPPARLEGRRRLRPELGEPLARLDARASSCAASATAPASATSSTRSGARRRRLELGRRRAAA